MLWELLVTDGHVRSARFRFVAIPLVFLGIIFVYLAAPPWGLVFYSLEPPNIIGLAMNEGYNAKAAAPVVQIFSAIQPLSLTPDQINSLPPASQLAQVERMIQQGLNSNGQAPSSLPIKDVPEAKFWAFNWPLTSISRLVVAPDLQIFGAVVTPPPQTSEWQAVRWLSVFRLINGKWLETDIAWQDYFYSPSGNAITPDQIPITLRRAMAIKAFAP